MKIKLTGGGYAGTVVIRHTNDQGVNMPGTLYAGNLGNQACVSQGSHYAVWEVRNLALLSLILLMLNVLSGRVRIKNLIIKV